MSRSPPLAKAFKAFVPAPLPPQPAVDWTPALRARFDAALLALGRLDAVTDLLPNASLLLYSFVRKEAVLSSMIEGTQSSLADLMLFELDEQPGVPIEDAREVSRYVAALEHGLARLRGGFPLSLRLLREVHKVLLGGGRGGEAHAGRVPPQPGLDRRHAAGQCRVRAAARQRARGLPEAARALPARRARSHAAAAQGGARARAVRDHPPVSRRQRTRRPAADRAAARGRRLAARAAAVPEPALQGSTGRPTTSC